MYRPLILLAVFFTSHCSKELEFMKGFLESIKEKTDIEQLDKCLKDLSSVLIIIAEGLEDIKTKHVSNMISGVNALIKKLKEIMNMIKPCWKTFDKLQNLNNMLKSVEPLKAVLKMLHSIHTYIWIIDAYLKGLKEGAYKEVGKQLGDLAYILFLTPEDNIQVTNSTMKELNSSSQTFKLVASNTVNHFIEFLFNIDSTNPQSTMTNLIMSYYNEASFIIKMNGILSLKKLLTDPSTFIHLVFSAIEGTEAGIKKIEN